jgi:chemosensory pili system protein ChpA (sensor histidine kinase/response regulator)
MVVDDSVSVRRVMANQLKGAGFNVLEAKDGLDALDQLHRAQQSPDLFLLDIEMPRMDGYELLASLRAQAKHRASPVVMVTSRAGAKHRKKAMKLGATDYLVKPYQADQLLLLIRSLLAAAAEPALSSSPG